MNDKLNMKLTKFSPLLPVLLVSLYTLGVVGNECIVTIQNGTIHGTVADTVNPLRKVCAFTAIPYAAPPVGPLRFKPPQPAKAWGSMNATKLPNWCPQSADLELPPGYAISEDCLFLNVYRPYNSNASLPVMIWFHGGGFTSGSSMDITPSKLLARGDVILVVVHYRLGLLGFISTGDVVAPGNFGLKDQALSIRWVHENINAFGGSSEQVIIAGQSAGARSVFYQMLSPQNKGLIHGVIAHSGTALGTLDRHPLESAKCMAGKLNCPTTSSQAIIDCISQLSWEEIIAKQTEYARECSQNMTRTRSTVVPVVEPDLPGAIITREPREIMKDGEMDNIPVILGATKHEASAMLALIYNGKIGPAGLDKDPEYMRDQIIPDIVEYYLAIQGDSANRAVASTMEMTYLAGVNRSSWNESMPGLIDLLTVSLFRSPIQATAELLSKRGLPVYVYSFEHHSENSLWSMYFGSVDIPIEHGIMHGDDLMYLFDFPAKFSREDETFSDTICDLWINFANSGNPTPSSSDMYSQWPTYDVVNESYMKLNVTPTASTDYRSSWCPNGFEWN